MATPLASATAIFDFQVATSVGLVNRRIGLVLLLAVERVAKRLSQPGIL